MANGFAPGWAAVESERAPRARSSFPSPEYDGLTGTVAAHLAPSALHRDFLSQMQSQSSACRRERACLTGRNTSRGSLVGFIYAAEKLNTTRTCGRLVVRIRPQTSLPTVYGTQSAPPAKRAWRGPGRVRAPARTFSSTSAAGTATGVARSARERPHCARKVGWKCLRNAIDLHRCLLQYMY